MPGHRRHQRTGSDSSAGGVRSILWLIAGLDAGGAEQLLVQAARAATNERYRYEVAYVLAGRDHHVRDFEAANVPVHAIGGDLAWPRRLRALMAEPRFRAVHTHSPSVGAAARVMSLTLGPSGRPRLVHTEHNGWARQRPLTRLLNRVTLQLSGPIVAVSDGVRRTIPRPHRARTTVIHHGIDLDHVGRLRRHRAEVRTQLGVDAGTTVIGTVANLQPEKALARLLRAAREVLDSGERVLFVCVGTGPEEQHLRSLHDALGLADGFRFLGFHPEATRIMAGLDLFALSSAHEGLPVVLMEAMALGLPVVSTPVGGVPEIVDHDHTGLLVPPDLLGEQLLALVRDPGRRAAMGAAGRERAHRFDAHDALGRIEDFYARNGI